MKHLAIAGLCLGAIFAQTALAQTTPELPGPNPTFREGAPLFSAQGELPAGSVIYDSYWVHEGWQIHCSQTEFCYLHLNFIEPLQYGGVRRYTPVVWPDGEMPDMSVAFGIKSNSTRTELAVQGFKDGETDYTGSQAERDAKIYPPATVMYFVDNQKVTESVLDTAMPLKFSIWTDWEPEKKPVADALVGALYNRDPTNMTVILYFDGEPKIGSSFNVKGFKSAWDAMQKERLARNKIGREKSHEFRNWPSGS